MRRGRLKASPVMKLGSNAWLISRGSRDAIDVGEDGANSFLQLGSSRRKRGSPSARAAGPFLEFLGDLLIANCGHRSTRLAHRIRSTVAAFIPWAISSRLASGYRMISTVAEICSLRQQLAAGTVGVMRRSHGSRRPTVVATAGSSLRCVGRLSRRETTARQATSTGQSPADPRVDRGNVRSPNTDGRVIHRISSVAISLATLAIAVRSG